jgi:G3E family GTPase
VFAASGGEDPHTAVEALLARRPEIHLCAVVTAVDARLLVPDLRGGETAFSAGLAGSESDPRTLGDVLLRQIDFADHVAVVRGTASVAQVRVCQSLLTHLNPTAGVLADTTGKHPEKLFRGRFDFAAALHRALPAFPPPPPSDPEADGSAQTAVWRRFRPLHPGRFFEALDETTATSLRSRGRLWMAGRPDTMVVWEANGTSLSLELGGPWTAALAPETRHLVTGLRPPGTALDWRPGTGDRCQHLVFTGLGLDTVRLFRLLDSCLLDPAEEREWAAGHPPPEDPFQPLFADSGRPDG